MASSLPSPWVFLLLLLCNPILLLLVGAVTDEGVALLSFKESIIEDPEGSLANWNSSRQHHCSWNGITCKQGTVISISLPKRRLMGSIPPALGSLRSLRHLNLGDNLLNGTLPPELSGAPKLQSLVLYGNSLSGSLPPEIGTLHSLQTLDLSHNSFSGPIPPDLIQCKRLKTLDFSRNNFSSSLPTGFGINFDALTRLDLSYNRLGGSIPVDIGSLSSLRGTADFSHNFFSGPIPASLGNLPETVYIDLTYNNLTGPIPQSGTLMNGGPTAFIGNPGLCGPPLKTPCSSSEPAIGPFLPSYYPTTVSDEEGDGCRSSNNGASLSRNSVIAIVASDLIGIGLIAMVVFYCCKRATNSSKGEQGGDNFDKGSKGGKECMCFAKEKSESLSENVQQQSDLVPLDHQVGFDLDALLRASAFILGKSGIGIVYKVVLEDGQTLAVRRLGEGGLQRLTEFQAEVEAIGKVRHPNIATLRAYYWSTDERLLIYDFLPNGNISKAIHGTAGESVDFSPLTWESRLKIMKGIAKGLAFLHEFSPKKYIHGDLKPSNILLGLNMEPCISDFGLGRLTNIAGGSPLLQSNRIPNENPQNAVMSSTSCYQAPEIPKALKPSQKWDVYSYGAILLELISGKPPDLLLGTSEMDLARWVQLCVEEKKPLSDVVDPFLTRELESEDEIIAILRISLACVQANPDKRPSMRHIVDALNKLTRGCDDH